MAGVLGGTRWPVAALVFGPDGVEEMTDDAVELLGVDAAALAGHGFADQLGGGTEQTLAALLAEADERGTRRALLRFGRQPPVQFLRASARRVDADGRDRVVLVLHDATVERRLDAVVGMTSTGVQIHDPSDFSVRWAADATQRAVPGLRGDAPSTDVAGAPIFHPDDYGRLLRILPEIIAHPGTEFDATFRLAQAGAEDRYWPARFRAVYLPDHPAIGGVLVRWSILLAPELADDALSDGTLSLAQTVPVGVLGVGRDGRVLFRNSLARALLGAAVDEENGYAWIDVVRPEHRDLVHQLVRDARANGSRESTIAACKRPDKGEAWLRIEVVGHVDGSGQPGGWFATFLDVTAETQARHELQETQERLWHLANHDQLTGLPNRSLLADRLAQSLARHARSRRALAVIYGDLDGFKEVNDELGHEAGDRVLVSIAERLRSSTRETDTVARLGGDEFVILVEDTSPGDAADLARRLIDGAGEPVALGETEAVVGLSLGVVVIGAMSPTPEPSAVLRAADEAMYAAKVRPGRLVVREV